MSDFLTRLVTATYQPAATVRPRPVAHYEPIGAVLPLWVEGEETSPPISAPPRQTPASPASVSAKAPMPPPPMPPPPMPDAPVAPTLRSVAPQPSSPMTPASAPLIAPPKAVAPLAAQTPNVLQPAPLPPITVTEAPVSSSQLRAQLFPRAPLIAPSHALPAPPRSAQSEDVSKREGTSRVTPTLAQGVQRVAEPLLIQVVAEPGATQPPPLPSRSAPPAAAPISAPRNPLDATQSAAPLPVALAVTLAETHRAAPERTRPADAFALRPQPGISAPPRAAPAAVTPPAVPTPPVIRVTIGRIVIKAEGGKPPKPTKPYPVPAKSELSLDAYLKSRRGGDA